MNVSYFRQKDLPLQFNSFWNALPPFNESISAGRLLASDHFLKPSYIVVVSVNWTSCIVDFWLTRVLFCSEAFSISSGTWLSCSFCFLTVTSQRINGRDVTCVLAYDRFSSDGDVTLMGASSFLCWLCGQIYSSSGKFFSIMIQRKKDKRNR